MSYQVFARKYRPQTFDDLVGQEHVTRTLKNAVEQNRLAHAYLFVGPRGIGKTSTARILAKALNCIKGPTVTPCGVCDSCKEIAGGNSLDVLEIDGASNNGVEQVRELRDNVRYAPAKGRYKIYIIDEVHMLTPQAFNALLKTLEEPPAHVKFIFATTEPQKVLADNPEPLPALRPSPHPGQPDREASAIHREKRKDQARSGRRPRHRAWRRWRPARRRIDARPARRVLRRKRSPRPTCSTFSVLRANKPSPLFREKILQGETAAALGLLDEQAAAGKEMMKFMSDLIAHLRDLLVFKVKPDALADEAAPELQSSLGAEAALHRDRPPARFDRAIRRRRRPDEMGAEQEAAFRGRGHQSHPNARSGHAHRSHRQPHRAARWRVSPSYSYSYSYSCSCSRS